MCGIFGIIGKEAIAESIYFGLTQMQHRGQDSAGIFTYAPKTDKHAIHKNKGLVTQVFTSDNLPLPEAAWGIGHVRYSTIGQGCVKDTQPLYVHGKHTVAMAHNGNIVNYVPMRRKLEANGTVFESNCDVEVLLHQFYQQLPDGEIDFDSLCNAVQSVHQEAVGAYSVVTLICGVGVVVFRDPKGIRPLLYGTRKEGNTHAFASETNSLAVFGCETITDVAPGEIVFIDKDLNVFRKKLTNLPAANCSFEYNYFSKPNTILEGREVYSVRKKLGETLAHKIMIAGIDADVVVPIPTTARSSALALARRLGVDYEEGFVKQDNIGRTFIMPTQGMRQKALKRKLAPVASVFKDKSVILVDDSVVRGTVSRRVVQLAREAGAKKVYFVSTYPAIHYPCVYGIDFPDPAQLITNKKSLSEIAESIDADGLIFNEESDLVDAVGSDKLCTACISGKYPTSIEGTTELQALREIDLKIVEQTCKK